MKDVDRIKDLEYRVTKLEDIIKTLNADVVMETFMFLNQLDEYYENNSLDNLSKMIKNKKEKLIELLNTVKGASC